MGLIDFVKNAGQDLLKRVGAANRPMLKDPDEIYPGQVLRIPPLES